MKVALLADIHANYLALQAVLDAAVKADVGQLLIAGDLVGYYFEPLKVWKLLQEWKFNAVRGNHEEMLIACFKDRNYLSKVANRYGSGIQLALDQFNEEQLDAISSLPHSLCLTIGDMQILLCHGAPNDVNQYLYPDSNEDVLLELVETDIDMVVLGHTHYPMLRTVNHVKFVNPGSVGQPRNRIPGAHWALLDIETSNVELRVEQYAITTLVEECTRRHPNLPYLADVLLRT